MTPAKPDLRKHHPFQFNLFRLLVSFYFALYTYVVATGLVPLPDEPPRINFWGVACVTAGMVIAWQFMINRYRLFLFSVLAFLPLAWWQLGKRMKFLEMMLEDFTIEKVTRYSLIGIGLILILPPVLRMFNRPIQEYEQQKPVLFKKGLPY